MISENLKSFIFKNYKVKGGYNILGNNENLVFSIKDKVFRLTKTSHRSEKELETETNLLKLLYDNKANVVKIINSIDGNLYKKFDDESSFITCFNLVNAEKKLEFYDNNFFYILGKSIGKIHKIISNNISKINYKNRLIWDEDIIIQKADILLPKNDGIILSNLKELKKKLYNLPIDNDSFGLAHTDIRLRNFSFYKGEIIHFDFDDITNHWYIYDLSVFIFHELENFKNKENRINFLKNNLEFLIDGYLKEKNIKDIYLDYFLDFMYLRLIYAYIDYFKRLKIKGVDSGKEKMLVRRKFILDFNSFIDKEDFKQIIYSLKRNYGKNK